MASKITIKPEELAKEINEQLQGYSKEVMDSVKKQVKKVGRESSASLRSTSPKRTGKYASHWSSKVLFESDQDIRISVYNKAPTYRLAHLLEKGHAKRGGKGKVAAIPHIQPEEQRAISKLDKNIKAGIRHCR